MTEDYKNRLFSYISGSEYTTPYDNDIQLENSILLSTEEGGVDHPNLKYLLKDNNGVENGYILYIDNIEDQETGHLRSIFRLRQIDGTYVKDIQRTTSNEELPVVEACYVDTDGTLFIKTSSTSTKFPNRIMLLNNICNKIDDDYKVKIRKSYNIQDYYGESAFICYSIYKSDVEAKYILIGYETLQGGARKIYEILECTINVGAENEYKLIDNLSSIAGTPYIFDTYLKWNTNGEYRVKILVGTNESPPYINELLKDYSSEQMIHNFDKQVNNLSYRKYKYSTYEDLIVGIYYDTTARKLYESVIFVSGTSAGLYDDEVLDTYSSNHVPDIQKFDKFNVKEEYLYLPITRNNGKTYIVIYYARSNQGSWSVYKKCDKQIANNNIYYGLSEIIVNKQYELNNLYTFNNTNSTPTITYVYLNQYVLYNSAVSMYPENYIPNIGILRDNQKIVLSRKLYNCIRQQNTITSTIDIPNLMLNDTTIKKEQLIANGNNMIDDNNEDITKNIYEEVLVNFNDTYNIVNNNNNTNQINTNGSTQLAKCLLDRTDIVMTKFRIVYGDNTSETAYLPEPTIDSDNRIAEYSFVIGTQKFVNRIEFISQYEDIIYLILTLNVDANKIYRINQKVRVN